MVCVKVHGATDERAPTAFPPNAPGPEGPACPRETSVGHARFPMWIPLDALPGQPGFSRGLFLAELRRLLTVRGQGLWFCTARSCHGANSHPAHQSQGEELNPGCPCPLSWSFHREQRVPLGPKSPLRCAPGVSGGQMGRWADGGPVCLLQVSLAALMPGANPPKLPTETPTPRRTRPFSLSSKHSENPGAYPKNI